MASIFGFEFPVYVFYLVPLTVFGPIFFTFLWNFGLKNLFFPPAAEKAQVKAEKEHAVRIAERRAAKAGAQARTVHPASKPSVLWLGQAAAYAVFALLLGAFSSWPGYTLTPPGMAQIKLSLSYPGERKVPCVKRSAEERAQHAPNMRSALICSRERWPVRIELSLDGAPVFAATAEPAGLSSDGASSFYEKFQVPSGEHLISVRMWPSGAEGFEPYEFSTAVPIKEGQNLVLGFRGDGTGFFLQ